MLPKEKQRQPGRACDLSSRMRFALVLFAWVTLLGIVQRQLTSTVAGESNVVLSKLQEMELGTRLFFRKLRKAPLIQIENEKLLREKLRARKKLREELEELKELIEDIRPKESSLDIPPDVKDIGRQIKFVKLAKQDLKRSQKALKTLQANLEILNEEITEARDIINNPEDYIKIPNNYGKITPEEVQEAEREVLENDDEIMLRRIRIVKGEEQPLFITDEW